MPGPLRGTLRTTVVFCFVLFWSWARTPFDRKKKKKNEYAWHTLGDAVTEKFGACIFVALRKGCAWREPFDTQTAE